jgi:ketosteroid isomerase-like protein
MKNAMRPIAVLLVPVLLGLTLLAAPESVGDEKAVIEKVIRDNIGWALTKDRALAESTMVHDDNLFIFNPNSESTIGWNQLVKNFDFWMDPRFKAVKCEIWDVRIDVSRSGDVAWWSCMLNDIGEWDGKPTGWKDTRWTGVMEKRDGQWLIVQMHFSFASDKIAAESQARLQTLGAGALQAAVDYIEGWFEGDADRVDRVLHPRFVRRIAAVSVAGDDFFWPQDRAEFLEATRRGGDKATPAGERRIKATVRDLARTTAVVRVDSAYSVEYLSLVKLRDRWQILNVLWENVPNDRKEAAIDLRVLEDYAGTYRSKGGTEWRVLVEGKRIFLKPPDEPRIEIFPESETEFFTKGYKSGVSFVRGDDGRVLRLVEHLHFRDFVFDRIR